MQVKVIFLTDILVVLRMPTLLALLWLPISNRRGIRTITLREAVRFLRSAYLYSLRSVQADLVRRAAGTFMSYCPERGQYSFFIHSVQISA